MQPLRPLRIRTPRHTIVLMQEAPDAAHEIGAKLIEHVAILAVVRVDHLHFHRHMVPESCKPFQKTFFVTDIDAGKQKKSKQLIRQSNIINNVLHNIPLTDRAC